MSESPGRFRNLSTFWSWTFFSFSLIAMLLAINQVFKLNLFGFMPMENSYLYLILAFYLSMAFLIFPFSKQSSREKVPWYDVLLIVLSVIINIYLAIHSLDIVSLGWEFEAPLIPTVFSVILWALVIDSVRRSSGWVLAAICLVFSIYPLFAVYMPGFLQGQSFDFLTTARNHVMSINSILGIPLNVVGTLLIGFMFFGVVLQATGGGDFFFGLAQSLLGHTRGGPAKVAVIASAFFGSMSGSAISNVITTGSMTIPAMKKTGYEPHYAGAVEACASTGGTIMPPVMGAAAFIMASFLGTTYGVIVLAAIIPSLLYYLGLLFQVDLHAYKIGLKGIPREQLTPIRVILKTGWYYLFVLILMTYMLFTIRVEAWAPFYASALLLVLCNIRRETRVNWQKLFNIVIGCGKVLVELVTILAAIGLLAGAMSVTGVAFAFSRELVSAVQGNLILILLLGALTSFILGMGMTSTAVYIFLAIVMVPALVSVGVDPIAAHFFVLYWGIVSFITPPVALAAYAASSIAQAPPMKTGFTAMKLGVVTYFVPFLFVYNPALLGQGTAGEVLYVVVTAFVGVYCIAAALEGISVWLGNLRWIERALFIIGGPMLMTPEKYTDITGVVLLLIGITLARLNKSKQKQEEAAQSA